MTPFRLGRRTSKLLAALGVGVVALTVSAGSADAQVPSSRHFQGIPSVGPLFFNGSSAHLCTASVVHSPGHNLILTAAHCIHGSVTAIRFAPGYHDGVAPYGFWGVTAAFAPSQWSGQGTSQFDYAFLTVRPRHQQPDVQNVEDIVGANQLTVNRGGRTATTIVGYTAGSHDRPVICAAHQRQQTGYSRFACRGFANGTSGSPWLLHYSSRTHTGLIDGVIGGYHQGGCSPDISYTARFDASTLRLLQRASAGGSGDVLPSPARDGC